MSSEPISDASLAGVVEGDDLCFPMVAGAVVGVLGIHHGATMTGNQRQALGVATGLLAIAVKNVQLFLDTREQSLRDSLTNCVTHAHGLDILARELDRAHRSRQPLSILMFDVDHFKMINDQLGHQRGDDLLRAVGAQLTRVLRSTDVRCRYGGDEFLIILPHTPLLGAQQAAESVRQKMATLAMVGGGKTFPVAVSVGIAEAGLAELGATGFIGRADDAMYQAKREGGDRCHVAAEPGQAKSVALARIPEADSRMAGGTEPDLNDLPQAIAAARWPEAKARLTGSLLVVEDDPGMRELIRLVLTRAGHEVVTVAGARAALAALHDQSPIALMLAAVVMPEMDGYELVAEARRRAPNLRVVFISAFAADPARHPSGDGFLAKPFTSESLTSIVAHALHDGA